MARPTDIQHKETKRTAILDAAYQCFAENGYAATRTADISAAAAMSAGNLFHYFSSKHDILLALVALEGDKTKNKMAALVAESDPLHAILKFIQETCLLAADPLYAGLALEVSAIAHRDNEVAKLVKANDQILRDGLTRLINAASRSGKIRAGQLHAVLSASQAATWIAALVDGLFVRLAADPLFNPKTQAPVLRSLVVHLLQGH